MNRTASFPDSGPAPEGHLAARTNRCRYGASGNSITARAPRPAARRPAVGDGDTPRRDGRAGRRRWSPAGRREVRRSRSRCSPGRCHQATHICTKCTGSVLFSHPAAVTGEGPAVVPLQCQDAARPVDIRWASPDRSPRRTGECTSEPRSAQGDDLHVAVQVGVKTAARVTTSSLLTSSSPWWVLAGRSGGRTRTNVWSPASRSRS